MSIDAAESNTVAADAGSGSNRLLVVGVAYYNAARDVSSITFNGVALSQYATQDALAANMGADIWSLANPDTGSHNLVVTMTNGTSWAMISAVFFSDVNPSTPLGTAVNARADSSAPSVDASSATNEFVFDIVAADGDGGTTGSVGAGQTERMNLIDAGNTVRGLASTEPGATTVTMSWSLSAAKNWVSVAVPIKP